MADLTAKLTLRVDGAGTPDLWRALAEATACRVVAFLPGARRGVTLELVDVPLGQALSVIADRVDASWRTRGDIIVFGPAPAALDPEVEQAAPTECAAAAWARTLTDAQADDLVRRRLLPVETLTPEQVRLLERMDPARGRSLRRGGADAVPATGVFFAPHCAAYVGDQMEGVETGQPVALLRGSREPVHGGDVRDPVVPPWAFMRDEGGYLVPAGKRRYDDEGNPLPPPPPPAGLPDETPTQARGAPVSLAAGDLYAAFDVLEAIREQGRDSVDAGAAALDQDLFVSPGPYGSGDLLAALCHATACVHVRKGQTSYLAGTETEAREVAGLAPLPDRFRVRHLVSAHLRHLLIRLIEEFDYEGSGMPFDADDFLDGERTPLERLSPAQQSFIRRQVSEALEPTDEVCLFPAFSITFASYASRCPPIPDALREYVRSEEAWQRMHENHWRPDGDAAIVTVW